MCAADKENKIRVLLIEDDSEDAKIIEDILVTQSKDKPFRLIHCKTLEEGTSIFTARKADIVLLDLTLPDSKGIDSFTNLHDLAPDIPIIILSGLENDQLAVEAVSLGAQDYIIKSVINATMLSRVLRYAVERSRAAKRIYAAEEKYRTIFENSAVAIILLDAENKLISWNRFTETLFGMGKEDLFEKPIRSLYTDESWEKISAANIRQRGVVSNLEAQILAKDAQNLDVEVTMSLLKDLDGEITGSITIFNDITERKRLEAMKDEFISTVSHELRTPMTIIREGVSQVVDGILGETTEDQRQILGITLEGIDRLGRIINDLLDVSKLEAGKVEIKKEYIDINIIVREVASAFLPKVEKQGLKLVSTLPEEKVECFVDKDKMIQVLTNLVGNALKFTIEGQIEIRVENHDDRIVVGVFDTGPGIDAENVKTVFDKFHQVGRSYGPGEKGTGLGLTICKALVEMHNGKIWAESELGKGTQFLFQLPKSSSRDLFKGALDEKLKEAASQEIDLSVVMLNILNFDSLQGNVSPQTYRAISQRLDQLVSQALRQKIDVAVQGNQNILVMLPAIKKDDALMTSGRMRQILEDSFDKEPAMSSLSVESHVACFPHDGKTADELLNQIGV